MKTMKKILVKFSPMIVSCLTIMLAISANSASCYMINQPKEPKSIERFKLFK